MSEINQTSADEDLALGGVDLCFPAFELGFEIFENVGVLVAEVRALTDVGAEIKE